MTGLCLRETVDGRCHSVLRSVAPSQWQCDAGHIWHGATPNVLKSTPWAQPILNAYNPTPTADDLRKFTLVMPRRGPRLWLWVCWMRVKNRMRQRCWSLK